MSEKNKFILDCILTITGGMAAGASTMDTIEQVGRIVLVFISICSGIFLLLVNWEKAIEQLKKWFK